LKNSWIIDCTFGIRVDPPTSTMSWIAFGVEDGVVKENTSYTNPPTDAKFFCPSALALGQKN